MKFIVTGGRKITLAILLIVFVIGFLSGDHFGAAIPVLNQRSVPIYNVDRNDKKISITLDGTWGADYTDEILNILKNNDIETTFFFAGYWLEKYPNLVKKIAREGHEIGNHTFTHPHCNSLSKEKFRKELKKTSALIEKLIGKRPIYFRPPYGEYNNQVINIANEVGYQAVQWSLDSHDWMEPGVEYIIDRIMDNVSSGNIILMHNNAPDTPEALKKLIPKLRKKGYEIVPLSELIYKDNYIIRSHNGLQVKQG
jgi:polysaccharide deacetylase family sporulation protein PdaB